MRNIAVAAGMVAEDLTVVVVSTERLTAVAVSTERLAAAVVVFTERHVVAAASVVAQYAVEAVSVEV
jgi:hypothetical protein